MKVAVVGGTGFIGNYVVRSLLNDNIEVIVTGTSIQKAREYFWFDKVTFFELNVNDIENDEVIKELASADKLINLAWTGLPNYNELFHFEKNLFPQYVFMKRLISFGLKDITVTGTCFEYGMKEGEINASTVADPQNPYAIAKDSLRKFLQQLQKKQNFKLKWLRLFYMYGDGQSQKSILAQLEGALMNGDEVFNMSGGEQLRDYLHVEEVSNLIAENALDNQKDGVYNVCSGKPIAIRSLVESYLKDKNKTIKLNLGYYPYLDYEPMAFWGVK